MHPRARRAISVALSVAVHALLLVWVMTWTVAVPEILPPETLPVRIIDPPPVARPQPAPRQKPPEQVAKAPPVEVPPPPPQPEPQPEPERKLPLPEQIVSPPDAGRNEVPPDTRFKSDRDVTVDEQQVKRGEPKPGESAPQADGGSEAAKKPAPKPPAAKPPPPRPPAPRAQPGRDNGPGRRPPPPQVAALPKLDRLMPNALQLAQEGYGQPPPPEPESAEARTERRLAGGNDGLFIPTGPTGTLDFLPEVREGNITLLNTKAEVFAPFVRRVALRVFQNFFISLKKDLVGRMAPAATETLEAEAVMSPTGEMVRFTILKRSPRMSLASDRRLQSAAAVGFFDRNPPPGARWEDGNIHFLFLTELRVEPSPRGFGFYVMLGAGLR